MPLTYGEIDLSPNTLLALEAKQSLALRGRYPSGRVIWAEDFEVPGSFQNWYGFDGHLWQSCRSAIKSRTGRYCIQQHGFQNEVIDISRTVALDSPNITKLGYEYWLCYSNNLVGSANSAIGGSMERWNGSFYEEYMHLYQPQAKVIVLDQDGSPGPVTVSGSGFLAPYNPGGTQALSIIQQFWHHFKCIVDIVNRKFVTLIVDNQVFDLTSLNLAPFGQSGGHSVVANAQDTKFVRLEQHLLPGSTGFSVGQPAFHYIDDIILTDES